jgi:hypothetical protein
MRRGAGYMFLESGLFKETVFQEETEYENGLFFIERKKLFSVAILLFGSW